MLGAVQAAMIGTSYITYLLKSKFLGATPQTLTNNQVMDTAAEGVTVGALTCTDATTAYTPSLDGSALVMNYPSAYSSDQGYGFKSGTITRSAGICLRYRMKTASLADILTGFPGFYVTGLAFANRRQTMNWVGTALNVGHYMQGSFQQTSKAARASLFSANTYYDFAILLNAAGAFFFAKLSGTWRLLFVDIVNSDSTLYAGIVAYNQAGTGVSGYYELFDVAHLPVPVATATLTTATEATANADLVLVGTFTAVTSQTLVIDWRVSGTYGQADYNCWRLKVAQGSSNNVTLHKVTNNSEGASLSTASHTINNATSYNIEILHNGTNLIQTYVAGVERNTYTTTDAHQSSATNVRLTLGTISTVSIKAYNYSGYEELSRV